MKELKKTKSKKLEKTVSEIIKELTEKEKRQDALLQKTREIVRECARAIKCIHLSDLKECKKIVMRLDGEVRELQKIGADFEGITQTALQEYVEVKCLLAFIERRELPSHRELGVPGVVFLNGLADCVGELRRQIQIALRAGNARDAEHFFDAMNEVYDELMTIKFSGSLVGALKRKQDVLRTQIEQARSEILRR